MRFESRKLVEDAGSRMVTSFVVTAGTICKLLGRIWCIVDHNEKGIAHHLIHDGYWEAWVTSWMSKVVQPGWRIIDIGANFGYYSLMLADHGCKVVAIEPQEDMCRYIEISAALNKFDNLQVMNNAVSNTKGLVELKIPDNGNKLNTYITDNVSSESAVTIQTIVLDDEFIHEKVDFIKIDVEGAERQIWYGLQKLITSNPNIMILMEWRTGRYGNSTTTFAKDIFERCVSVHNINYDGCETVIETPECLIENFRDEDAMLVLRFS